MKKYIFERVGKNMCLVNSTPRTSLPKEEIQAVNERLLQIVRHQLDSGGISHESILELMWADEITPAGPELTKKTWYL